MGCCFPSRWLILLSATVIGVWPAVHLQAQANNAFRKRFHQAVALRPRGRFSLENPNGGVRVEAWDRNQVNITADISAPSKECLKETDVVVHGTAEVVHIHTRSPDMTWVRQTPCPTGAAWVEYTINLPSSTVVEDLEVTNGNLSLSGLTGFSHLSSVNGSITVDHLSGGVKALTVNGPIIAAFDRATHYSYSSLTSTNGAITVTIPDDANAEVAAESSNGALSNDFGFPVYGAEHSGRGFIGTVSSRLALIRIDDVNGAVSVKRGPARAQVGRS